VGQIKGRHPMFKPAWLSAAPCYNTESTRNSAIAHKPRDALRGRSRSPNMVPLDMLGMVSYYRTIVTLSVRYIRLQKCRDLENRVKSVKVIANVTIR